MSHTPEQAKELWCPMVRLAACNGGSVAMGQTVMNLLQDGRETTVPDAARCIADKCAMWRWLPTTKGFVAHPTFPKHGYCGIAGRTEVM